MICKNCKQKKIRTSNSQKFCSKFCRNEYHLPERRIKFGSQYQCLRRWKQNDLIMDLIPCEICGHGFRQPGSHIVQIHEITAREYREIFGFDVKRGQLTPDLRKWKGKQVFLNGTVKNLKLGKKFWFKPNDSRAGRYSRSSETMERLRSGYSTKKSYKQFTNSTVIVE